MRVLARKNCSVESIVADVRSLFHHSPFTGANDEKVGLSGWFTRGAARRLALPQAIIFRPFRAADFCPNGSTTRSVFITSLGRQFYSSLKILQDFLPLLKRKFETRHLVSYSIVERWTVLGLVPKESMKIARQFTAGSRIGVGQVPKGRPNEDSAVPSGLGSDDPVPGVKTPGYYRKSLRDWAKPSCDSPCRVALRATRIMGQRGSDC